MAFLRGKTLNEVFWDLRFQPIMPTLEGPHNAYEIEIWRNNEPLLKREYTVTGFQLGHRDVFRVANAFQHAPDLMDLRTEYIANPPPFKKDWAHPEHCLSVRDDCGWFEVVMWGATVRGRRHFSLLVYLSTGSGNGHDGLAEASQARISCWPEDVAAFGHALEAELVEARKRRIELNLMAPFD